MFLFRTILLFLTWCAFSGLFDAVHLTMGLISSLAVAAMCELMPTSRPANPWPLSVKGTFAFIGYLGWLVWQIFLANLQVLRISLSRSPQQHIAPQFVEFRTRLKGDFARFVLAHSITLTPGTVTVRLEGDKFTVNALTQEMAQGTPGDMETRLLAIFGADEESDYAD
jgi:multicomponent Na+:H+ antiporter subunit E